MPRSQKLFGLAMLIGLALCSSFAAADLAPNDLASISVRVAKDSNLYYRGASPAEQLELIVTITKPTSAATDVTFTVSSASTLTNKSASIGTYTVSMGASTSVTINSTSSPVSIAKIDANPIPTGSYSYTAAITSITRGGSAATDPIKSDNTSTVFVKISDTPRQPVPETDFLLVAVAAILVVGFARLRGRTLL